MRSSKRRFPSHVWALEEVYLRGDRAAARYIWHRPFKPFLDEWIECA